MIAFTAKRTDYRFLSVATGFSAGVMLYVSFVEIFFKGVEALTGHYGDYWGHWVNTASFFGGMLLIGLIDNLIPAAENPHEIHSEAETMPLHNPSAPIPDFSRTIVTGAAQTDGTHDHSVHHRKLMRMGLFTALAIGIHNLPEGLAPVVPFDYAMLPDRLRPWVQDVAERMQCPPDFVAVPMVAALWPALLGGVWAINKRKEKVPLEHVVEHRAVRAARIDDRAHLLHRNPARQGVHHHQ